MPFFLLICYIVFQISDYITALCQFKEGENIPRRVIDLNGFTVDKSDYDNKGRGGLTGLAIVLDNSKKLYQKEKKKRSTLYKK